MRSAVRRASFIVAAILALRGASSALAAEEAAPPQKRVRVMAEFLGPEGMAGSSYADSFASTLIQSPAVLSVLRASKGEDGLAVRAAREACQVAISLSLSVGTDSYRIEWKIYAPPREEPIDQGSADRDPPDARGLSTTFWLESVAALERAVAAMDSSASFVTIVGAPGTLVAGIGADVVVPESGSVDVPLVLPAYLVWKAASEGALDEGGAVLIQQSGTAIVIPRRPVSLNNASPWSLDASAFGLAFPEISARYELGKRFFLRATFTQYLAGLNLVNWSDPLPAPSILASIALIQPGAGVGFLVSPRASSLRLYSTFDLFARIQVPAGEPVSFDPVAPMGTALSLGFDWGRSPDLRLFFEAGIAFYPWAYPGLMLASYNGEGMQRLAFGGTGWFAGHPGWFAEFPVPRFGLRIRL
jgi:hypothetical protein